MIASQAPLRYCGRCGAPLPPNATFCGRCGTPVLMQAAATQPFYGYPLAPRAAYPTARQYKLAPALIAGGLVLILIVVAVVVGGIAISQFVGGNHTPCTSNCSPKFVTPLPAEATYVSSAYRFQVNYFSQWTVRTQDAHGITLGTKLGQVQVTGSTGGNPDQILRSTVSSLPTSQWQDVTLVGTLKGAHIGNQDGVGEVYAANLVGSSQTAAKVRFAVIVASHGGVTVAIFALGPADPKNFPYGMPEGQAFDYLCTEFGWA